MEPQQSHTKKIIGGVIALGVIVGVVSVGMRDTALDPVTIPPRQDTAPTEPTVPTATSPSVQTPSKTQSTTYTDGTYSATGTYTSPAGTENVSLTLIVQNDTVLSSVFKATSDSGTSKKFQKQFTDGYISQVVGKNISDIKVGKVSGSSLTGKGFNDALSQIKAQAKI